MKQFTLILSFCLINFFSGFAICSGDSRSFTEILFQNKDFTIFKCKIQGYAKGWYTAQVLETFMGKIDGNIVKLNAKLGKFAGIYKTGDEVLVYSSDGAGTEFNLNGTCDDLTKIITPNEQTQHELKLLAEFADIFKNKKSGEFKFYYANKVLAAEGNYKSGKPAGTWKHYYANTQLKTEQDFENNVTKYYAENGFISSYTKVTKDSTLNLIYSNKTNGNVSYKFVDIPNDSGFVSVNYEFYENKNIKLIQSLAYLVKGTNTSFSGTVGKYSEFWDNGKVKVQGNYSKSKRVGIWKYFDKTGKLISEFDNKDGDTKK